MKLNIFFSLVFLIVSISLYASDTTAEYEPYTQWGLPDGAKARLGKGGINVITCTSDGTLLAVASKIGIWIYDVQTSEELALLTGHTGSVDRIAFSPDGNTLAIGGQDNTLRLWDVSKRTEIGTLQGHIGQPDSIFFSPDGRTLASQDDDNALRLWDVDTQTQIHTLEGYTGTVESVSFSPDGLTLAIGGQDEIVRLWNVDTQTEVGTLEGHNGYVSSVSFSPDGKKIVSGSHDGTVRLWEVDTRTEIGTLEGHTWRVNSVVFSSDGKTIVSASDGTVRLWEVDTRTEIGTLGGAAFKVSFSPDGQTIATIARMFGQYSDVNFWDVDTLTRTHRYNHFEHWVSEYTMWEVLWVVAAPNDDAQTKNIVTIVADHNGVLAWGHNEAVASVSFSPDGRTIAASFGDYYLRVLTK